MLPHPLTEMQNAKILVFVDGIPEPFHGTLVVDRHPTDDTLLSTVVLLSGLKTDGEDEAGQMPVRLPHKFQAAIGAAPATSDHYSLAVPSDFFDPSPPPVRIF